MHIVKKKSEGYLISEKLDYAFLLKMAYVQRHQLIVNMLMEKEKSENSLMTISLRNTITSIGLRSIKETIEFRGLRGLRGLRETTESMKGLIEMIETIEMEEASDKKEEIVIRVIEIDQKIVKEAKTDTKNTIIQKIIAEVIHHQQ